MQIIPERAITKRLNSIFAPTLGSKFPNRPCMKRVYRDKKASFHWSAAMNKERFSSWL